MGRPVGDRAVVLGASMAGLLAARVLADAYTQVTVVDRDQLPEGSAHRRGVPQGHHIHALLARGQQALEELFPGLTAELVAQGVPAGDMLANARVYLSGHRLRQARTGLVLLCASRPVLEGHVRARVRALPNVAVLDSCDIAGLAATPDGRRVTGAWFRRREGASAEDVLDADLVVDATGRGSRTPVWLEALGYARPAKNQVRIRLGYATRNYRLPRGALGGDLAALHGLTPQHPRGGALQVLDDRRLMVSLGGVLGDHPPTDPDGFLTFARSRTACSCWATPSPASTPSTARGSPWPPWRRWPCATTWSGASSPSRAASSLTWPAWSTCRGTSRPAATWSSPASLDADP
jgi:hypothetical protein